MFCTRCGQQNADNAKFCFSCGNIIKSGPVGQRPINQGFNRPRYIPEPVSLQPSVSGIVFSVLMMVSCFLPFIKSKWIGESHNFVNLEPGFGIAVLVASIIALIFSVLNKRLGVILPGLCSIAGVVGQFIYWIVKTKEFWGRAS